MSIRFPRSDHREQYRAIRREILEAIDQVLSSECLVLGPKVEAFERQMCHLLGVPGHGVGVACGTDSLAIALRALNIGPGDEVITVAFTAVGTVSAIRMAGATPVFCDIDPRSLLMDPQDAAARITGKTRAIIPVHLYGNAVEMKAITRLAEQHRLKVIEDCAQSCGTTIHGRATGTWGDVGCFSFYPTKNLAAYGDGGLCYTQNTDLSDAMRAIRNYGRVAGNAAQRDGVNSRLDELQAAVLEVKMRSFAHDLQRRKLISLLYQKHLGPECVIPQTTPGAEHSYHLFVVQVKQRERVMSHLRNAGIECGIHYPMPIHLMHPYRFLNYQEGSLPVTERAADHVLSLPCYPGMPLTAVEHICSVVHDALANG